MPGAGILVAALGGLLALGAMGKKTGQAPAARAPLDPGMPPELDARIRGALATVSDPSVLEQMATTTDMAGYRNTSAVLRARAAQLRGQLVVPGVPLPMAAPGSAIPASAFPGMNGSVPGIPSPASPPAPRIEDLDPGIPPQLARAVAGLLAKPDLSPEEIAFADQLANTLETAGYPRAAAKVRARVLALKASRAGSDLLRQISDLLTMPPKSLPPIPTAPPPGVPAIPGILVVPPGTPLPTRPPTPQPGTPAPVAPLARTYRVARSDTPWNIAQHFTRDGNRYRELAAANPDKSARILQGKIFEGETLTLPDAWPLSPVAAPAPHLGQVPSGSANLQEGSTGPDVATWQRTLGVTPDGIFGRATATATRTWQAAHGLTPDGVVGPQTRAASLAVALPPADVFPISVPSTASPPTHETIRQGSSGPEVVAWQRVIGVSADGRFGPGTAAATRAWQTAHGLPADGVVGPHTWAAATTQLRTAGDELDTDAAAGVLDIIGATRNQGHRDGQPAHSHHR